MIKTILNIIWKELKDIRSKFVTENCPEAIYIFATNFIITVHPFIFFLVLLSFSLRIPNECIRLNVMKIITQTYVAQYVLKAIHDYLYAIY